MKTLKKILIISVIAISGILLMLFIMVYSVFWTDEHTYYDMDDCTPQQSQDIFLLNYMVPKKIYYSA